ncbi:DUF5381 family protein [Fictibacillus iocasae]|uniref:DUF5381 family protein n=1 Tax=Fictibacillus iocasae TaxID=2715437 RepID=A0ABW2NQD5_9BACL
MNANVIKVRGHIFMYIMSTLFLFGGLISCYFIINHGLKLNSLLSYIYLAGGIVLTPFFIYETLWALPGFFPPGKVLFTITPGTDGFLLQKQKKVSFHEIKKIDFKRSPINLFNELYIDTHDNKKIKFKTYNLLHEVNFFDMIDEHIYPYLPNEAKRQWDEKKANSQLIKDLNYEGKNHKID